jgi:hypothetical protein
MCWTYTSERLKLYSESAAVQKPILDFQDAFDEIFGQPMLFPRYAMQDLVHERSSHDRYRIGGYYSYVPKLGQVIWQSSEGATFHAYLFQTDEGRSIGYLRLPHYDGGEEEVAEFGRIMDYFQEHADALVIDQLNNPGGSPLYLYALASTLFDQPFRVPKHRVAVTHHEAAMAATMLPLFETVSCDEEAQMILGNNLRGMRVNYQMAQLFANYLQFMLEQWKIGHYITDACAMYGIDYVNPHPQHRYTKPILLLINSLDFSGADFFPAILQDNRRALLLGERTAGAGGTYFRSSHLNPFGVRCYGITTSLAVRSVGNRVLENLGVTPDVPYALTAKDLQHQGSDYKAKILSCLQTLLSSQSQQ